MKWLTATVAIGLLFVTLLSTACAGPLPSAESMVPNRAYLPDTEEQTTTWTSPNVDGGPFMEANKTITEIILNIDQNTGLRHTRQAIEPAELPAKEQPYLFFVMRQFLVKINRDGTEAQALRLTVGQDSDGVAAAPNAIACDFDARDHALFWSDVQLGAIYAVLENGSSPRQVMDISGGVADGIAWDWINKKLYWTDARHKTVEVLDPVRGHRKLLFRTGSTSNPRVIVLDPTTKQMYLTDWGMNPSIQRASMDGTSIINLHTTGLVWPNGLTIDHASQTLYWADASLDRIETSNADGSGRRVLITEHVFHPFGIAFFEGALYWTDWQTRAIITAPVSTPRNFGAVISNLILDPMGIHMVSVERQPSVPNPCAENNGGCTHLCLLSNTNSECFTCACPDGMYISTNKRNCISGVSRAPPLETTQVCIPECQNNGLCISTGICGCMAGWTGARCEEPICTPECQNQGTCVETGVCLCTEDWEGPICGQAVCDEGYCLHGGECIRPNFCSCLDGWAGPRCERPICSPDCANGMCTAPNTCVCEHGWTGGLCDQPVCNPECENGVCTAPDVCSCEPNWRGVLCTNPICTHQCQHGGRCVGPDTCECTREYTGATCETAVCFPPVGCLNGGICVLPSLCVCVSDWSGRQCEIPICDYCPTSNGRCTDPEICTCNTGWQGPSCTQAICPPQGCLNNGFCLTPGACSCAHDFTGPRCEQPVCANGCINGECTRNHITNRNECLCDLGWEGPRCGQAICHPPCANGGTCILPGHCACPLGINGYRCELTKF